MTSINHNQSKEEISFFKNLLLNNIRPDGRLAHQSKKFKLIENTLSSSIYSLELKNKETNIYFSLIGELSRNYQPISLTCDSLGYKSVVTSKFTGSSSSLSTSGGLGGDNTNISSSEVQEIFFIIDKLILSKIDKSKFRIQQKNMENTNDENSECFYWNFNINIYSLEKIYFHNLQTIAFGINYILQKFEVPLIEVFHNQFTRVLEYNVVENSYEKLNLILENLLVIGSYNGNLFLDPSLEELSVIEALVLLTINDNKITHFETSGFLVDLGNLESLENFVHKVKDQSLLMTRLNN
jgi:exosome complex RNA-binding protein Rrp42 (RNase PH superfamily)